MRWPCGVLRRPPSRPPSRHSMPLRCFILCTCGVKDSDAGLQDLSFSEKERLLRRAHLEIAVNVVNGNGKGVWEE